MIVNKKLNNIAAFLELNDYVGNHSSLSTTADSARIYNFSFQEINQCCSLSNSNRISLFCNRVILWVKTGKWLNDSKLGFHLFYEYLWVKSITAEMVLRKSDHGKNEILGQINLLNRIFNEIILITKKETIPSDSNAQLPSDSNVKFPISIPEKNLQNPEISQIFPIRVGSSLGFDLACNIIKELGQLKEILENENPYQAFLGKICIRYVPIARDGSKIDQEPLNKKTIRSPLDFSNLHSEEINGKSRMEEEEVIQYVCTRPIAIHTANEIYQVQAGKFKGKTLYPTKILLELEAD
jgi:hypothetical protein